MTDSEAIKWLELQASKSTIIMWDDYSEETLPIRLEAESRIKESYAIAINAIKTVKANADLLKEYDTALHLMVEQYCTISKKFLKGEKCGDPDKEVFFHSYMCAGEHAFKVLGIENGQEVPEDWSD